MHYLRALGVFCLLLAGSFWQKQSWLPCMERSYYRLSMRMLDIRLQHYITCYNTEQVNPDKETILQ